MNIALKRKANINPLSLKANELIAYVIIIWMMIPYCKKFIPTIAVAILFGCWLVTTTLVSGNFYYFKTKYIALCIFFLIFCIYSVFSNDLSYTKMFATFFTFFLSAFIYEYFVEIGDNKTLLTLLKLVLISLAFTSLTTLYALSIDPTIARRLSTGLYDAGELGLFNVGGFGVVYSLVFLLPIIFWLIRYSPRLISKLGLAIFGVIGIITVYAAGFTMGIIFCLLLLLFSLSKMKAFNLSIILLLCTFVLSPTVGSFLYYISTVDIVRNNLPVSERINQLATFVSHGELTGDIKGRSDYYLVSISTLKNNYLFGNGTHYGYDMEKYGISGHSELLDTLARFGVIGMAPLVLFFYFDFKTQLIKISDFKYKKLIELLLCGFFIISIFNTIFYSSELGVILFLFFPSSQLLLSSNRPKSN